MNKRRRKIFFSKKKKYLEKKIWKKKYFFQKFSKVRRFGGHFCVTDKAEKILLIDFCRLNWAVTWSVRDSTPGQGNPWPIFPGNIENWTGYPNKRSPTPLLSAQKGA